MRKNYDEPEFIIKAENNNSSEQNNIADEIKYILEIESFAVLSTQGEGQPYSSLISYAYSEDLKKIIFATPSDTRKFNLISKSDKVSVLVDTRSTNPASINEINAITITGQAKIIKDKEELNFYTNLLVSEHPYLDSFVKAPNTEIIVVDVFQYIFVKKFQEVIEWSPN